MVTMWVKLKKVDHTIHKLLAHLIEKMAMLLKRLMKILAEQLLIYVSYYSSNQVSEFTDKNFGQDIAVNVCQAICD